MGRVWNVSRAQDQGALSDTLQLPTPSDVQAVSCRLSLKVELSQFDPERVALPGLSILQS